MKGKIQIVGEPGVPKKKNIASVGPQVIIYGSSTTSEIAKLVKKFVDDFDTETKNDFLLKRPKIKNYQDYRKFERFSNDRFKR